MKVEELTDREWDLVMVLRNYRKARPRGRTLRRSILDMVTELMSSDPEDEYNEED